MRALHSFLSAALGNTARKADKRKCWSWSLDLAHIKPFVLCSPAELQHLGLLQPQNLGRKPAGAGRVRGERGHGRAQVLSLSCFTLGKNLSNPVGFLLYTAPESLCLAPL